MTIDEKGEILTIAKEIQDQFFPLPSEKESIEEDNFIRKVCQAIWSSIGYSAKNSLILNGLKFHESCDFEKEWMKHKDTLYAYIKNQSKEEYQKALKTCWSHRFKFNNRAGRIIFHSDLSLSDTIRELYREALRIKEMD